MNKGSKYVSYLIAFPTFDLRHCEAVAQNIYDEKLKNDPNMSGKWIEKHPDRGDCKEFKWLYTYVAHPILGV